jgi:DUF1680 family protein
MSSAGPVAGSPLRTAALKPVEPGGVVFDAGSRLGEWQATTHESTIAHIVREIEACGAIENLRQVRDGGSKPFAGMWFADSDVYKVLEAVAWDAGRTGSTDFLPFFDETVELLRAVQLPDGYINSWFQRVEPERRWQDLGRGHEMYCAGHLIQAGIAAARALDRYDLLVIARRFADHLVMRFGAGRIEGLCGHPEIETALVELYRQTGVEEYLDLARLMIDRRGHGLLGDDEFGRQYFQDLYPVREADEATGHAVRQLYLAVGATDLYLETGDPTLLEAMKRVWSSAFGSKTYVTGGQGARHRDESFGDPYELPPDRAYAETCAAIASFQWNWRMLLATGEARFGDAMEWTLHNAIAASTDARGTNFFYSNPLQLRAGHDGSQEDAPGTRLPWYKIPCCPPNVARLISSLNSYVMSSSVEGIQIHQYNAGIFDVSFAEGKSATLRIETNYPWSPEVRVTVIASAPADEEWILSLRVPSWATGATVAIGPEGEPLDAPAGYARISRQWKEGETVTLRVPMVTRPLSAHPHVDASRGTVAVTRGPLVYCLEQADYSDELSIEDIALDPSAGFTTTTVAALSDVPVVLQTTGRIQQRTSTLYSDAMGQTTGAPPEPVVVTLVPYFRWGNRQPNPMRVWIPLTLHDSPSD